MGPIMQEGIEQIMRGLGDNLGDELMNEIARSLPPIFQLPLRSGRCSQRSTLTRTNQYVREATGWQVERTHQFTRQVLHVVAAAMDAETRERAQKDLPSDWARQLQPNLVSCTGPDSRPVESKQLGAASDVRVTRSVVKLEPT